MKDDESQTETPAAETPAAAPALRCRLNGERFHSNGVPQRLLKALEGLFRDAVRCSYLQDNPGRRRLPRGYISEVDIKVSTADGDKTYVSLGCNGEINSAPAANGRDYVERTYSEITTAIQTQNQPAPAAQSSNQVLGHLTQLRKNLSGQDTIDFLRPDHTSNGPAQASVHCLRQPEIPNNEKTMMQTDVRGVVTQIDRPNETFQITMTSGFKLFAPLVPQHLDDVKLAYKGNKSGKFIHVRGIGEFDQDRRLLNLATVEELRVTELSDLRTRLEHLGALEDGWLDGEGIALSKQGLDWVEEVFADHYPKDLLRPYIYPTPEGGVLAEWHLGIWSASLEIDLSNRTGWWHVCNFETDTDEEKDLDLTDDSSWSWLEEKVRMMERTKW